MAAAPLVGPSVGAARGGMGEPAHPSWRLQAHLSTVWGDHAIAGANAVKLVDASAGTWAPRPGCAAPQVLFYVVGHFRTFAWTQHHLAAVAAQSARPAGCALVAAFVPDEVDAPAALYTPSAVSYTHLTLPTICSV